MPCASSPSPGEHRALRSGDMLFRQGDTSDGGFVVTKGAVGLEPQPGHEAFIAGPGALIGQTALFCRTVRGGTAIARETSAVLQGLADADAPRAAGVPGRGRRHAPGAVDRAVEALRRARAGQEAPLGGR